MKILILLFSCNLALAQNDAPAVAIEEIDTYLEAIKDVEVQEKLKDSPQFAKCRAELDAKLAEASTPPEDGGAAEFQSCIEGEFEEVDEASIKELAENLELKSYNKKAAQSSTSIREYLSKRLKAALYGVEDLSKAELKDQNFVNHDVYYQLYAEQIGKNTLLEVSKYCLETFYVDEPTNVLRVNSVSGGGEDSPNAKRITSIDVISSLNEVSTDPFEYEVKSFPVKSNQAEASEGNNMYIVESVTPPPPPPPGEEGPGIITTFFRNMRGRLKEAEVCSLSSKSKCDKNYENQRFKPVELLVKLKDAEYTIASNNKQTDPKDILRANYEFCAGSLVRNMCEVYKCRHTYNDDATEGQKNTCLALGEPISTNSTESNDGVIACSVMKRLSEYRNVLAATQQLIKDNEDFARSKGDSGFELSGFKGIYQNKKGKDGIDELTSISSRELTENVDSFANSEEFSQELKEKCFVDPEDLGQGLKTELIESDDDCRLLGNKINREKFDNIRINQISITQVQKEELRKLEETEEALLAFLERNGMNEFFTRDENGNLKGKFADLKGNIGELKKAIEQELEAEKQTVIANIQQKFFKETKIDESAENSELIEEQKTDVAQKAIADIEQHQKRVQATLEYSNLVSSYLTVQDAEGRIVGENSTGRQLELQYQDAEALQEYFTNSDEGSSSSGSGGNNINYLDAIDLVIGVTDISEEDREGN